VCSALSPDVVREMIRQMEETESNGQGAGAFADQSRGSDRKGLGSRGI